MKPKLSDFVILFLIVGVPTCASIGIWSADIHESFKWFGQALILFISLSALELRK